MVCAKALYNYVDAGLIGIKNHHHSKKIFKKSKQNRANVNKNSLPRKLLEYKTVDELFEEELDKIYQVDAAYPVSNLLLQFRKENQVKICIM